MWAPARRQHTYTYDLGISLYVNFGAKENNFKYVCLINDMCSTIFRGSVLISIIFFEMNQKVDELIINGLINFQPSRNHELALAFPSQKGMERWADRQ